MKKWIYLILAAAFVAAILFFKRCGKGNDPEITTGVDSAQYWKTKYGQEVASVKKSEQDFNKISQALKDSIEKLHNVKISDVRMAAQIKMYGAARLEGKITPTIIMSTDSTPCDDYCPEISYIVQPYENEWYNVVDYLDLKNPDSSYLYIQTRDIVRIVEKEVKEGGWLSRKHYIQFDFTNDNPYNKIQGLEVYKRPLPKPKRFGIGPYIGVTYDGKFKPSAGVSLQYSLIQF